MEAAGPYDRAQGAERLSGLGDVTFLLDHPARSAISVLLILGGIIISLIIGAWAGDEGIRPSPSCGRSAGRPRPIPPVARCARADLRHADHLGGFAMLIAISGRSRHRHLPHRTLSANGCAARSGSRWNCSPASPRSSTACGASSCSGPFLANSFPAVHDQGGSPTWPVLNSVVRRPAVLSQPVQCGADPLPSWLLPLHHRDLGRRVSRTVPPVLKRSGLRRRLHHLGSRPQRCDPLYAGRRDRRRHAWRSGRALGETMGRDFHHRQLVSASPARILRAGHHDLGGDRLRIRRERRPASIGPDPARPVAVRC